MDKKRVLKIIIWFVLIILAIFLIMTIRKFVILKNLVNTSEEYESKTNYLLVASSIQKDRMVIRKSYNKDGNYLTETKMYGEDFDVTLKNYKKDNEVVTTMKRGEEKETKASSNEVASEVHQVNETMHSIFNSNIFGKAISTRITNSKYNDKDCYLIEDGDSKFWVDKDAGLILRKTDVTGVSEYIYEFDSVTDEDIIKPEI